MKKLYIIKCGSTFDSIKNDFKDFEHWIIDKFENKDKNIVIINAQENEKLPTLTKNDAVILTGSHSMVTHEEFWSLEVEKWLPKLIDEEVPLLAICYGHQLPFLRIYITYIIKQYRHILSILYNIYSSSIKICLAI